MKTKSSFTEMNILRVTQKILKTYPDLSQTELRVCFYLSMNLPSKSIADITNRSLRTIEYTRNNIRKKMKLKSNENLVKHIIQISH